MPDPITMPASDIRPLSVGMSVQVKVPASSANLGPGFDCLGVALGVYDDLLVETVETGIHIEVHGEAADTVPRDDSHLVVRALRRGLSYAGFDAAGLRLTCTNTIPHSRGLGSSAAAVVSGLAAASGLVAQAGDRPAFTDDELVQLSSEFEGHPDNAAASVLGSAVVTWTEAAGTVEADGALADGPIYRARRLDVHPDIRATVFVPDTESSTSYTRSLLPDEVPRADAVFNLSRAALAVVALSSDPACLLAATADKLHQPYRAAAMAPTAHLVQVLRSRGCAAMVSGAGPSLLALGTSAVPDDIRAAAVADGFAVYPVAIAGGVQIS